MDQEDDLDSMPETAGDICSGWIIDVDEGIVVLCGKTFGDWVPNSQRMRHWRKCAERVKRWKTEEGWQLGMKVQPSREEAKAIKKQRPKIKYQYRAERQAYSNADRRCSNPDNRSFPRYGGRGIEFRFTSFEEFIGHIGSKPSPELTLDRIQNDGHYEIGNVRWATQQEQVNNTSRKRRRSSEVDVMALLGLAC